MSGKNWNSVIGGGLLGGAGGALTGGLLGGGQGKPDFQSLAHQQTMANRPNINAPWANTSWEQGPGGQWTMNLGLPGEVQNAFTSLQGNMASAAGWDPTEQIQQAINANWDQSRSRLDPMWQQRNQAFQSQMANQGLDPGTEAFGASAGTLGRQENDAYQTALRGAIGQGNETARTAIAAQMLPYQQYGSLINSSMAQPHFAPAGDYAQAGMDEWNAGQAQQQGMMNGASSLAQLGMLGAFMFSDEALKDDIERLPYEVIPGVPVANWRWKDGAAGRAWGVIAQDVERVAPELVWGKPGRKMVDYAGLMAR